jgi:hypothetical protein
MHEDGIGMARAFEAELLRRPGATPRRDDDPERAASSTPPTPAGWG